MCKHGFYAACEDTEDEEYEVLSRHTNGKIHWYCTVGISLLKRADACRKSADITIPINDYYVTHIVSLQVRQSY